MTSNIRIRRVVGTLKALCDLSIDGSNHSAYGLAYIFSNLTVTVQELRKRAFKDKEITPEQYDELQRLTRIQLEQQGDEKKLRVRRTFAFLLRLS